MGPSCNPQAVKPVPGDLSSYQVVTLAPGADLEARARAAMLAAKPGTVIDFPAGFYEIEGELNLDVSHVALRGKGMSQTILSFRNQGAGAQGIVVTADAVVIQDLAVEDTKGDAIKIQLANGVTIDRVRVEWTNGPARTNGAYGFYPVDCQNVLIQNSVVKGASDAGIYVGQSETIVVRYNDVQFNVAGIEIENSLDADVYLNRVTNNTGGILVFDMPNLPKQGGRNTRVFLNAIYQNNTQNFAHGGAVGVVPAGTGVLVLANDEVEIMSNFIHDNGTMGITVASIVPTGFPNRPPAPGFPVYDGYPERVHVHGNTLANNGMIGDPNTDFGRLLPALFKAFGAPGVPDIVYDGFIDPAKAQADGQLPPHLRLCVHDNTGATFGNIGGFVEISFDDTPFRCAHPAQPTVVLDPPLPLPTIPPAHTPEEIDALCHAAGVGVNWAAFAVDCPELADYRLFATNDPTGAPNPGGVPFDLTTPLFSDYATKYRVAFLPPPAPGGPPQPATYDAETIFDFPVGTIIAKTFTFRVDQRDPSLGERWVETRLLIRRATGWVGLPYVWADDRSSATLEPGGAARDVSWIHFDGGTRITHYRVPNTSQCTACHSGGGGNEPIGPKARMLNGDFAYPGGVENQLEHWAANGFLAGLPALPVSQLPRLPVWNDPNDGTLEARARTYLEINCAHCHNPQGRARFSGLHLEATVPVTTELGVCKPPTAAGTGGGNLVYDIVPGDPASSILIFRMASVDPAIQMPELSKSVVHDEGVQLIANWIATLPGSCQ